MKLKVFAPLALAGVLLTSAVAAAAVIVGTPGNDILRGTEQADRISAFAGNDLVYARGGGDDVRAGMGDDGVRAADGNDLVYGGRGNDIVAGGDGNDHLYGGSDSDQVNGGNGNDRVSGNKGDDSVSGNDGNDSLFGGWGADRAFGGSGNDELHRARAGRRAGSPQLRAWQRQGVGASRRAAAHAARGLREGLRRRRLDGGSGRGRELGRGHGSRLLVCTRQPSGYQTFTKRPPLGRSGAAALVSPHGKDPDHRGRRRHRPGHGASSRGGRIRDVGVANGETGLARLRYERPDVCVLDSCFRASTGGRSSNRREQGIGTPVVVVSAPGTEHDGSCPDIGADDYLVKPFSMKNSRPACERPRGAGGQATAEPRRGDAISIEELRLDPDNVQAYVDGASADLTPTEFRLLYTLAREQGRVLTRDELLQRVWGRRATHRDRTVDVFVRKLREKVDRRAPRHTFIHTRYGVGYKLEAEPK